MAFLAGPMSRSSGGPMKMGAQAVPCRVRWEAGFLIIDPRRGPRRTAHGHAHSSQS
jgi:hypothetical protein